MEPLTCAHCGAGVEGEGIRHRRRLFCGDECCDQFEEGFLSHGGPDAKDLEEGDDSSADLFEDESVADDDDDDVLDEDALDDELDDEPF